MSMYDFHDTTIATDLTPEPLPAEALQINGVWLDRLLPEFRTLYVSGRELLPRTLTTQQMGALYGSSPLYSRFPERTITVGFALLADSPERFREAFNELQRVAHEEAARLVFNDEPDKYFTGTLTAITQPEPGSDRVVGEMIFTCPDPRKRALYPVEVYGELYESGSQVLQLYNSGNIPAPVTYEVLMNSENGFVGFSDGANSLQFGYADEVDGGMVEESEVLFTLNGADFFNNSQLTISDTDLAGNSDFTQVATCTHTTDWSLAPGDWLAPRSLINNSGGWGVALKTVTIPPDSQSETGAANFELSCVGIFEGTAPKTGVMRVSVTAGSTMLAYVHIVTNVRTSTNATVYMGAGGQRKQFATNTLYEGPSGRGKNCRIIIRKSGSTIYIAYGPFSTTFEVPSVATTKVTKATVCFGQWHALTEQMSFMGIRDFSFRKDYVERYVDIPNRYQPGDLMEVNGSEGRMYLNGQPDADDEIIGSEYFPAQPGMNQITVTNSLWADQGVTVKAIMREAWL